MNNLLVKRNEEVYVSSRIISEKFGKRPSEVNRKIKEIMEISQCEKALPNLIEVDDMKLVIDEFENRGKMYPEYLCNEELYLELVMGFTGAEARKLRVEFRAMFKAMKEELARIKAGIPSYEISNPVERAKVWIEEEEVRLALAAKIEEDAPKVEFAEAVETSDNVLDIGEFSKVLAKEGIKLGRTKLFQILRYEKILMKNNLPYQKYIDRDYFEVKITTYNKSNKNSMHLKTVITGKGIVYLTKVVKKNI